MKKLIFTAFIMAGVTSQAHAGAFTKSFDDFNETKKNLRKEGYKEQAEKLDIKLFIHNAETEKNLQTNRMIEFVKNAYVHIEEKEFHHLKWFHQHLLSKIKYTELKKNLIIQNISEGKIINKDNYKQIKGSLVKKDENWEEISKHLFELAPTIKRLAQIEVPYGEETRNAKNSVKNYERTINKLCSPFAKGPQRPNTSKYPNFVKNLLGKEVDITKEFEKMLGRAFFRKKK